MSYKMESKGAGFEVAVVSVFFLLLLTACTGQAELEIRERAPTYIMRDGISVAGMSFLVSVNLTWGECIQTVRTPLLKPDQKWNETAPIVVGKCDRGPLTYKISQQPVEGKNHTFVEVTFYTTAIHVQPPSCSILWDYQYKEPQTGDPRESLLPGCFISDSQEGYHVTYYWLYILEWLKPQRMQ